MNEENTSELTPVVEELAPGELDWKPEPGEVSRITREILESAVEMKASDIHFNSHSRGILVRFRVHGLLQDHQDLSAAEGRRVIHHLKALADMNIIERRRPQDGRVLLSLEKTEVDLRLATVHGLWGENLAVRVFDKGIPPRGVGELGLHPEGLHQFLDLIRSPQGMFLVTGPTGTGKTASLYAALGEIRRPEINLLTVEDPVEYEIEGVNQIGVQPKIGVGFLECLRSAFRQDPDVLMIGEVRDTESARIAIRAALSGHLVLSTLHSGTAAEAVAALVHLGIEPFLISTSLIGVMAQQLVRRICPHCAHHVPLELPEEIGNGMFRQEILDFVRAFPDAELGFSFGEGCEKCFQTGYGDRAGLFEILRVTPRIRRKIIEKAQAAEIEQVALREGMLSMRALGIRLVLQGVSTIEEVLRVVPLPDSADLEDVEVGSAVTT